MSTGAPMSSRQVVTAIDGNELVLVLTNGRNYLAPLSLLASVVPDVQLSRQNLLVDQVDNTSDLDKPISTAVQAALDLKAGSDNLLQLVAQAIEEASGNFALAGHNHVIADVTGLQAVLDDRVTAAQLAQAIADGTATLVTEESVLARLAEKADANAFNLLTQTVSTKVSLSDVQQALTTYATEEQVAAAVAGKADAAALQAVAEGVSALEQSVAGKADQTALDTLASTVVTVENLDAKVAEAFENSDHVTQQTLDASISQAIANSGHVTTESLAVEVAAQLAPAISGLATEEALSQAVAGLATADSVTQGLAGKADQQALLDLGVQVADKMTANEVNAAIAGLASTEQVGLAIIAATEGLVTQTTLNQTVTSLNETVQTMVDETELATALQAKASTEDVAALTETVSGKANTADLPDFGAFLNATAAQEIVDQTLANTNAFVRAGTLKTGKLIFVDNVNGSAEGNGSLESPFSQIQQAIDAIVGQSTVIQLFPSTVDYEGFTVNGKQNFLIQGFGASGSHAVNIAGTVKLEGAGTTRVRLKDLKIEAPLNGVGLWIDGTSGRHYLDNVSLEPTPGTIAETLLVEGEFSNWLALQNCSVNGIARLAGAPASGASVFFNHHNSKSTKLNVDEAYKVYVRNAFQFGPIVQQKGYLEAKHISAVAGANGVWLDQGAEAQAVVRFVDTTQENGNKLAITGPNVDVEFTVMEQPI